MGSSQDEAFRVRPEYSLLSSLLLLLLYLHHQGRHSFFEISCGLLEISRTGDDGCSFDVTLFIDKVCVREEFSFDTRNVFRIFVIDSCRKRGTATVTDDNVAEDEYTQMAKRR